jgi:uncharacterized membrane protein
LLQYLVNVTNTLFFPALLLAVLLGVVAERGADKKYIYPPKFIYLSGALGLLTAFVTALLELNTRVVVREYYNLALLAFLIVLQIAILFFISFRPNSGGVRLLTPPVFLFLPAYSMVDIFLFPSEFSVGMDNIYNAEYLLKWFGYIFALITALILFLAVFKVIKAFWREKPRLFRALAALLVLVLLLRDALAALYIFLGRGFIPQYELLINVIFFLSDRSYLFFTLSVTLTAVFALVLFFTEKKKELKGINPAVTRKLKAESLTKRRFSATALIFLIFSALFLQGGNFLMGKNIELTPPEIVTAEGGVISFPLETFADGRLKRYQFRTSGGVEVRFIIIKKPGGGYGVGLDACEICGQTGYYEKKDRVICIRCDVSINIGTIGFQGGCNPVPITFEIREQKLFIPIEVLEKEESRFQ